MSKDSTRRNFQMTMFEFIVPVVLLAAGLIGTAIIHFRYKKLTRESEEKFDENKDGSETCNRDP